MSSVPQVRIERPAAGECSPAHYRYVVRVPETDIVSVLEQQIDEWRRLAASVAPEREDFRYAPGKWSVRDVFCHVADSERVFGYGLLAVVRGERTSLPGMDENAYVVEARPWLPRLDELAREFVTLREANLFTVRRLDEKSSVREGIANIVRVTARALSYVLAGHVRHHMAGLMENYGLGG